jgi:hypothetical protein
MWTPQFENGPIAGVEAGGEASAIDLRLVDRFGEPPEVLYLEVVEGLSRRYRIVEQPLPSAKCIYIYCLVRIRASVAFYGFVGQTGAST